MRAMLASARAVVAATSMRTTHMRPRPSTHRLYLGLESMRIAIDIRKINEFGVGTYIWNLVRNIAALDTANQYLLVGTQRHFHELGPLPPNFKQLYHPEGGG